MKKNRFLALLLALLLALALTACGGGAAEQTVEEAPAYLGTYNLVKIVMGPVVMDPVNFGYQNCFMELKDDGKMIFDIGTKNEEIPYTVEGTALSVKEGDQTLNGTIENDQVALTMTAADLGGEGDKEAMVMYFGKAGTEAETKLKDEVAAAGTLEEQVDAMSLEQLQQFMEDYGFLFES